jgi:hypothetical protein
VSPLVCSRQPDSFGYLSCTFHSPISGTSETRSCPLNGGKCL